MSKKRKGMVVAVTAFASSPQGRRLIQQAKEYASRPETKAKAQQLVAQARSRRKGGTGTSDTTAPATPSTTPSTAVGSGTTTTGTPPRG